MCDPDRLAHAHVLDWLEGAHERQRKLCAILEEIADSLPGPVDGDLASSAVPVLRTAIGRHSAIQERILFPLLRRRASVGDNVDALIAQISRDNVADELLAHDTADQIEAALAAGRPENPGMLAYMLRGLFDGRRRHIAWEVSVLFPLARERLRADDLTPLRDADIRALLGTGRRRRKDEGG